MQLQSPLAGIAGPSGPPVTALAPLLLEGPGGGAAFAAASAVGGADGGAVRGADMISGDMAGALCVWTHSLAAGGPMGGSAWRATAALQLQPAEGDRAASVVCMQVTRK